MKHLICFPSHGQALEILLTHVILVGAEGTPSSIPSGWSDSTLRRFYAYGSLMTNSGSTSGNSQTIRHQCWHSLPDAAGCMCHLCA